MLKKKSFITTNDLYKNTQDILDLIQTFRKELKDDIVIFKEQILNEIVKLREDMTEVRIEKLENKVLPQ